jgi:hypothetical protein
VLSRKGLRIKEKTTTSHLFCPFLISFPKGCDDKNGDGKWGVVKIEEASTGEGLRMEQPFEKRGKPHGVLILHGRLRRE